MRRLHDERAGKAISDWQIGGDGMNSSKNRFINFPLFMIAETHTNPEQGMRAISTYVIVEFARNCKRDYKNAFLQACYQSKRHPDLDFPQDVTAIMADPDVTELAEAVCGEGWSSDGTGLGEGAMEIMEPVTADMDADEQEALVKWCALRDAAHFFNHTIHNFDGLIERSKRIKAEIDKHAQAHGPLVSASCPADYFNETVSKTADVESMRMFRTVCAVRSLIGSKQFCGTTKDMLRARMIGAKSPVVATTISSQSKAVKTEQTALASRKRFDRILADGAVRGFYGKYGEGRRIHLSLNTKDPAVLAGMVKTRKSKRAEYLAREAAARGQQRGTKRGSIGGSIGGTFNKSLIKTLNNASQ